jgi:hypothetical protein
MSKTKEEQCQKQKYCLLAMGNNECLTICMLAGYEEQCMLDMRTSTYAPIAYVLCVSQIHHS